MSRATDAARARVADMGNLTPQTITTAIAPVPVYTAPTLAGAAVTLEPRRPLLAP